MPAFVPNVLAEEAPYQATLGISATVAANCIVRAPQLVFGPFDGTAPVHASSTLSVGCANGTSYSVQLGTGSSGTFKQRLLALAQGDQTLEYNLFTDATYQSIWGDGSQSTREVGGEGHGMAEPVLHDVFGELPSNPANDTAPPGEYRDVVTVTVRY